MRILIAEDDQVLADGLLRTLRASGAAVDHVGSGTEAAPQGLYVTPRDIDRQVRQLGRLLGYGISLAVQPGLTAEELAALAE